MTLQTLDIWISLAGLFALVALLCTGLTECVEAWRKQRAVLLHGAIRMLLGDGSGAVGTLLRIFYEHPAINPLYEGRYAPPRTRGRVAPVRLPSYIPARSFALAVLDIAAAGGAPSQVPGPPKGALLARAREYGACLGPSLAASQLRLLLDTHGADENAVVDALARWYDTAMERLSGRYKRRTLWIGFASGALLAAVLNIEPLTIANSLRQGSVQTAAVAQALQQGPATPERVAAELARLDLPVGWRGHSPFDGAYLRGQLPGWLVTGLAAMLGAPFWFDLLNRLTTVRASVKPRAEAPAPTSTPAEAAVAPVAAPPRAPGVRPAGPPPDLQTNPQPGALDEADDACVCALDPAGAALTPDHELPAAAGGVAP